MLKKIMIVLAIITLLVAGSVGYGLYRLFNRFGSLVNAELSNSYFYNRAEDGVIYSPMGNWFELGETPVEVDLESFEVLSTTYAKDKNHGYCRGEQIKTAIDVPSFMVKYDYVPMDKDHVYWPNSYSTSGRGEDHKLLRIKEADPETYTLINPENLDFAKDKKYVFYRGHILEGMDKDSFEILTNYFCKDANCVLFYRYDKPAELVTTAAAEIVVLSHGYIRNHQNIYTAVYNDEVNELEMVSVSFQEATTITFFDEMYIGVDGEIYYNMKAIKDVDVDSFELLSHGYAKDAQHIFYKENILEGADKETFAFDQKQFRYKDKYHVYHQGIPE